MLPSRRDLVRGALAAAALASLDCRPREPARENGRVVVSFWYAYGDLVRKVLLELVGRFNASQSRVVVKAVHQGDYFEGLAKLRTAIAAGCAPALSHVVLEVLPYLAGAGVLEPLDAYEGVRSLGFVPELEQRGSFAVRNEGRGEPLVGIPFNRSTPVAYANGRLLAREGVGMPETWDQLADVAARLTRRGRQDENERWGFEVPISWWYWVAMLGQAGGRIAEPDGRVSLGDAAGEDAVRFWQRLVRTDRVMRLPPGRDYQAFQSTNESFLRGRAAMMWSSTAYVRYLENTADFPVVAAPLPRSVRASVPTGGTMFVLLRAAPDEEKRAAWEFVRWMCEPDQTVEWSTRTGYMPVTIEAVERLTESGWYERHPNDRVAYEQLRAVEPWPWMADLFRVERDVVEPRLEEAVIDGRDARAVMAEARSEAARPG